MDENKLSFLGGQTPAEAPAPATEAAPAPEPVSEGPARGPDGKFVAAAPPAASEPAPAPVASPEPVAAAAPAPAAPPAQPADLGGVYAAMMDERDKRKALETQLAELQAQRQQPAPTPPDIFEDPEGHAAFLRQEQQAAILNAKLEITEDLARAKHGDALVDQVQQWLKTQPRIAAEGLQQRNPYEFAVIAYQRDQIATQMGPADLEDFRAWQAAKAAGLPPNAGSPAPQPVAPPPRSLASAPNAGGAAAIPLGPGQAFDLAIRK